MPERARFVGKAIQKSMVVASLEAIEQARVYGDLEERTK